MKPTILYLDENHTYDINSSFRYTYLRDAPRVKNPGGLVVMRRAAAAWRRLLICQNLGGQRPPQPPTLLHAWSWDILGICWIKKSWKYY